jgi:hypothetical protein
MLGRRRGSSQIGSVTRLIKKSELLPERPGQIKNVALYNLLFAMLEYKPIKVSTNAISGNCCFP